MNLSECRNEIDKIDKELVELFEKRMNVAINVAKYKIENKKFDYDKGGYMPK